MIKETQFVKQTLKLNQLKNKTGFYLVNLIGK